MRYDYRCPACERVREVSHAVDDHPSVECECGAAMRKKVCACSFSIRSTSAKRMVVDQARRDGDMVAELRRDYGIHKFTPLGGNDVSSVYRDVKQSGDFVRERMACEKEKSDHRVKMRQRDWAVKANRRVARRTMEAKERRAAEDAARRAIVIH